MMLSRAFLSMLGLAALAGCYVVEPEQQREYSPRELSIVICEKRATAGVPMMQDKPFVACMNEQGFPLK